MWGGGCCNFGFAVGKSLAEQQPHKFTHPLAGTAEVRGSAGDTLRTTCHQAQPALSVPTEPQRQTLISIHLKISLGAF